MTIDVKRLAVDSDYWSEVAPEGATHYDPADDGLHVPWMKLNKESWYCWEDGWCGPLNDRDEFISLGAYSRCIPRPQPQPEWVDGLPPVGAKCEYAIGSQSFRFCCFVGIRSSGSYVIESVDGEFKSYHPHQIKFRPIPTPEQRQRDELIAALKEFDKQRSVAWREDAADFILSRYTLEVKS